MIYYITNSFGCQVLISINIQENINIEKSLKKEIKSEKIYNSTTFNLIFKV